MFSCFSLLSSLLLFFGSRPGTNGVGTGLYHQPKEVESPSAPDSLKVPSEQYGTVAGLMIWYEYIRSMTV